MRRRNLPEARHCEGGALAVARILNSGSNNMDDRCTAYIEARGPRWLAVRLARYALRHSTSAMTPDWASVRTVDARNPGRLHWRFSFAYRRG